MSESSDKWWAKVPAEYTDAVSEDVVRSAYTAGLLRAAEIVDETEEGCGYGCPNSMPLRSGRRRGMSKESICCRNGCKTIRYTFSYV